MHELFAYLVWLVYILTAAVALGVDVMLGCSFFHENFYNKKNNLRYKKRRVIFL